MPLFTGITASIIVACCARRSNFAARVKEVLHKMHGTGRDEVEAEVETHEEPPAEGPPLMAPPKEWQDGHLQPATLRPPPAAPGPSVFACCAGDGHLGATDAHEVLRSPRT